jgi:hypothetical protein
MFRITTHQVLGSRLRVIANAAQLKPVTYNLIANANAGSN